MIMVAAMAAVLWGIGVAMDTPKRARWTMIGILFVAVAIIQLALPPEHALRQATGGDIRLWAVVLGFTGIILGYRHILKKLRKNAKTPDQIEIHREGTFSENELDRYARHIILREVGGQGQKKLLAAKVLVVGAGGLGAPALQYLAAAGVGTIGVIDDDIVENANLQRQIIHTDANIGKPKVHSAAEAMLAQNPNVDVQVYHRRLEKDMAEELFDDYDLVLDGTDNFDTRYLVNECATKLGKPLISGALTQWEGQLSVFDPANDAPCYSCVFPNRPDPGLVPSCAEAGVIGPLPGVVGSMMAVEAIKVITGAGETLRGRLMIYDALYAESRIINVKRLADCPVCSGAASG